MSRPGAPIGKPDPMNAKQYFHFTRSLRKHLNATDSAWLSELPGLAKSSLSESDLEAVNGGMNLSGHAMLPFQMQENLSTAALHFELPYYVTQGPDDLFTPTEPAEAYFEKVTAPRKKIVILEGAGHFALATHPQQCSSRRSVRCSPGEGTVPTRLHGHPATFHRPPGLP